MSSCDIISFIHMPFDSRFYMRCFPITWPLSILCFTKIIGVKPIPEFLVQECYRSCTFVASSIVRILVNLVDIWKAVTYINQKSCCCRCILGYRLLKHMHMSDVSNMSSSSHHCICNVPLMLLFPNQSVWPSLYFLDRNFIAQSTTNNASFSFIELIIACLDFS